MIDLTPERRAELRELAERAHPFVRYYGTDPAAVYVPTADLFTLLNAADERDRLAAVVERVRVLHRSVGIYDECDCSDLAKTEHHRDIYEVGLTCNKLYDICDECCRDDIYQSEDCANHHEHKPGERYHCPTIRALDGTDEKEES